MERNRVELAQKFIANRAEVHNLGRQIVQSSELHPGVTKDVGLRQTLLDSSITTYRAMLFALGSPIQSIRQNSENVREAKKTRNGVLEFAKYVYETWDTITESSCVGLVQDKEYVIPESTPNP